MAQVGIESLTPRTLDGMAYSNQGRNLKTWWNFEDFIDEKVTGGSSIWLPTFSGAGAYVYDDVGTALRPGIIGLTTGTTTTGIAAILHAQSSLSPFLFGGGCYVAGLLLYSPNPSIKRDA